MSAGLRMVFSLPAPIGVGGMGQGMLSSVRAALAEGWDVRIVSAPGGSAPTVAGVTEIDTSGWMRIAQLSPLRFGPAWLRLVRGSIHDRRASRAVGECDVFQGAAGSSLLSMRAARSAGARCVLECMTAHARHVDGLLRAEAAAVGSRAHFHNRRTVRRSEEEYALADVLYCNSSTTRRSLEEAGLPASKILEVPLAVEIPERQARHEPDAKFRVLFVGYLTLVKGFRHLLAAWERLKLPGAELCLRGGTGDRPCRRILEEFRRRIEFTQDLDYGPVPYHEFSVLVLPSISDGFGLVVLEAMAAGLPVIVTENVGAGDCVREGVDGFVVPVADPGAIAERLEMLHRDRTRLAEMGRAARERAGNYSPGAFRERYCSAIREIAGR